MILKKIENVLILILLFLFPWQTRYIWHLGQLNGGYWEYGTFSIYGIEILLWVIILLFFVRNCFDRQAFRQILRQKRSLILLFIFLAVIGLSAGLSENFWVSFQYVLRWLEAMVGGVIVATHMREGFGKKYLFSLWLGGAVQGLLAIYQFLEQHVFGSRWLGMAAQEAMQGGASVVEFADQRWLRAYGSFGSPNSLGIYLAVVLIVGFILYLRIEWPLGKILISVGQLVIVSGLLVSFSRGAWLAAIVGVSVLVVRVFFKEKNNRVEMAKQVIFALVISSFWVVAFLPVFSARFNLHNRLEARSIRERQGQYVEALSFIKQQPFFGVGPGVYTFALAKKYPEVPSWLLHPVHNIYVLSIVEFGIFFSLFLGWALINGLRQTIKNNPIFLPVLVTVLIAGLFDHWLFSMFSGLLLWWAVWGLSFQKLNT